MDYYVNIFRNGYFCMKKYEGFFTLANMITSLRIICAVGLIFTEYSHSMFYILYLICGITDAIDGTVARMTKTSSVFGAKLDSVADLMFYAIMVLKFFPILLETVSGNIWFAIILIVIIRVAIYLGFALKYHTLASNHTYLNKLTGAAVFCLPFVIKTRIFKGYSVFVCIVAFVAAVYEGVVSFRAGKSKCIDNAI